jgi:D-glycero-alpha-D-manno-heptose-7-phosphate kinase
MRDASAPLRVVHAVAPIRICDNGGWTDTWFAEHGKVFNIAVLPGADVEMRVHPIDARPDRVVLHARNYGDSYTFAPGALPGRHPLLEAAVDEIGLPDDVSVEIDIASDAPSGCATGTSAAVTVALIGALDALTPGRMTRDEIASAAHRIEVERLGNQSGVQDQLCAAYGGINYIEISPYPHANVSQLAVPDPVSAELERRLILLFLGRPHRSSDVHERVIAALERDGRTSPQLDELRHAAESARDAVDAADFKALGQAMIANTDAQAQLHPDLVGAEARAAIGAAAANGAIGWKVNGAGGAGGSVTFLCGPDAHAKDGVVHALHEADPRFRNIPIRLSRTGLRVWGSGMLRA